MMYEYKSRWHRVEVKSYTMNAALEVELRYMFNMLSQLHLMMYESKEYKAKPWAHQIEYDIASQIIL